MGEPRESSRREFLSGEAARREILRAGEAIGDAIRDQLERIPAASDTVRLETRAMACPWCVILNPGPPRQVMAASDALSLLHDIEARLTIYRDDSLTAHLNRAAVQSPVSVDEDLFEFLKLCESLWTTTEGTFDPASGKLIDLWRACRLTARIPAQQELEIALSQSGMQQVLLDESSRSVRFRAPVKLDFAAIGKGLAIDRVAEYLTRQQVSDFLVHGGHSSLRAQGRHAGEDGWPVGIRNPLFTERPFATILLKDQSLSSSGSNIQYFRHEGRRYGHILDPRTGWPAEGLLSATVVTASAAQADALSTALYVMGVEAAQQYCAMHPEVGAVLFPAAGQRKDLNPIICNIPPDRLFFHDPQPSVLNPQPSAIVTTGPNGESVTRPDGASDTKE